MTIKKWSEKDLLNKWQRSLSHESAGSLPWAVLEVLVKELSSDTKLPVDILLDVIQRRDVSGLFEVAASFDVTLYTSADLLLQDRLVVDLFSKFDFPESPFNKEERARLRYAEAETLCRETNARLFREPSTNDVNAVIHTAINHIERVLGRFDVDEMLTSARFGPGASLCVKGAFTTEYFKYSCRSPTVSTEAFPYAEALLAYDWQWKAYLTGVPTFDVVGPFEPIDGLGVELSIADFNKATFVPKNAKTLRSIAIEPYFNVYFQLGVGGMIRRALKRIGIDLDSQLKNQALARKGSIDNSVATIDFSMASDTIARETVRLLLPPSWFEHLDRLRSKYYRMDDQVIPYYKFSSMGNGYTFELETLIFYAVAFASCETIGCPTDLISVFGDDVILPVEAVDLFTETCRYLGFKTNEEKSFYDGLFRESCGEDFLGGHRVRPVFCKELGTNQHVVSLANRLFALNRAVGYDSRLNDMLSSAVRLLLDRIPRDIRSNIVGPPSENVDGYIHTDSIEILQGSGLVKWDRRLFAWRFPIIRFSSKKLQRRDDAVALWMIKGLKAVKPLYPDKVEPQFLSSMLGRGIKEALLSYDNRKTAREITGRKFGEYVLGTGLVWSLGGTT